jgi:hypothetical protein
MQLQQRKMDILKASIKLAAYDIEEALLHEKAKSIFGQWLLQKSKTFPAAAQLNEWVATLQTDNVKDLEQAVECLAAFAEQTDKLDAIELALLVFASDDMITSQRFNALSNAVDNLGIKRARFLALCQKILLFSDCKFEDPAFLLGIDDLSDEATVRLRLNEEYRKWNARVTHPDEDIRRQADRILSLIADLRSRRIASGAS